MPGNGVSGKYLVQPLPISFTLVFTGYRASLDIELPWMPEIGRPTPTKRMPVALTGEEVGHVLLLMNDLDFGR